MAKSYETKLTPKEELAFRVWKQYYAPNDSGEDYDLRGAFKAGVKPDTKTGHWPDTFKKPNHPTFSTESKYAKDAPEKAGHWEGEKFIPPKEAESKWLDPAPINRAHKMLEKDPNYTYGSVLPLRMNEETGEREWALPDMIRSPITGLVEMFQDTNTALHGKNPESISRGLSADQLGYLIGGPAVAAKPAGALGTFAGRTSQTADRKALGQAMSMASQGKSRDTIFDETGWFVGPDGKWRYEIPDTAAKLKTENIGPPHYPEIPILSDLKLNDILDHPELFAAYPDLADIKVKSMPILNLLNGERGAYSATDNKIWLAPAEPKSLVSTTLHETGHGVQKREGFALGGNVNEFITEEQKAMIAAYEAKKRGYDQILNASGIDKFRLRLALNKKELGLKLSPEQNEILQALEESGFYDEVLDLMRKETAIRKIQADAYDNYRKLYGEAESRNVQLRYESPEESLLYPWLTLGKDKFGQIPENELIVKEPLE